MWVKPMRITNKDSTQAETKQHEGKMNRKSNKNIKLKNKFILSVAKIIDVIGYLLHNIISLCQNFLYFLIHRGSSI